tara:strand:+ start:166 stop:384 length:219 start_codon:yes stop_codon:yes gene_type:complete
MSAFDYKILNTLISIVVKNFTQTQMISLWHTLDDIALAYIEDEGYIDPKGGITQSGYTIAKSLDFNEYSAQA